MRGTFLAFALWCFGAVGCHDLTSTASTASLLLTPEEDHLLVGDTLRLHVAVEDASGQPVDGATVQFSSSNPAIATVSSRGLVTTHASGAVTITATDGTHSASAHLLVRWGAVIGSDGGTLDAMNGEVSLRIPPGTLNIGTTILIDSAAAPDLDSTGVPGRRYAITPASLVFNTYARLTLRYPAGAVPAADEPSISIYSGSTGQWLAVPGGTLDRAHREAVAPIQTLGVYGLLAPGPVASVSVIPGSLLMLVLTSYPFAAELRDAVGHLLSNRSVAWESSDTTVLRISPLGVATTTAIGVVAITASTAGVSGSAQVLSAYICTCSPPLARGTGGNGCGCTGPTR